MAVKTLILLLTIASLNVSKAEEALPFPILTDVTGEKMVEIHLQDDRNPTYPYLDVLKLPLRDFSYENGFFSIELKQKDKCVGPKFSLGVDGRPAQDRLSKMLTSDSPDLIVIRYRLTKGLSDGDQGENSSPNGSVRSMGYPTVDCKVGYFSVSCTIDYESYDVIELFNKIADLTSESERTKERLIANGYFHVPILMESYGISNQDKSRRYQPSGSASQTVAVTPDG